MSFETHTIDLLVNDPSHLTRIQDHFAEGQTSLTANYYTVPGVTYPDGTPRALSIGQLVMALCLQRATELEAEIVKIIEDLNKTSEDLERLTEIEKAIVNATDSSVDLKNTKLEGTDISYYDFLTKSEYEIELKGVPETANSSSEQLITDIEAKMDSHNSFSQQTMIDLQSQTAKRDQSYDMISNILKSLNTTLMTNVNNI
ncbi:MAG: hypothetical protein IKV56_04185 [Kiritimatiellae bacterium]|nr:hypothetical protein [Kiritimatiellia bacterium]